MKSNLLKFKMMSDVAIVEQIALFIRDRRLLQNKTQAELATEAGISRKTLYAFESGVVQINLLTLIQLLRALNCLYLLENFELDKRPSPLVLAKLEKDKPKRARSIPSNKSTNKSDW